MDRPWAAGGPVTPSIEIYRGSCLDLRERVPSFDVMIVDPPYRADVHAKATSQSAKGGTRKRDLGFARLTVELRRYLAWCAANVRRWSLVYSDVESANVWRHSCEAAGAEYIRPVPWIRWSMPQLSGDRPTTGWELVTVYHRQNIGKRGGRKPLAKHWNGPGNMLELGGDAERPLVLRHSALRGEEKHKCQKPLDQALDLVSWFSDPGDTVFDGCGGRMTIGVACAILGRNFVGCETDEAEADKGELRCLEALDGQLIEPSDPERLARWLKATEEEATAVLDAAVSTEMAKVRALARLSDAVRAEEFVRSA